jgi:hypothetical protein
MGLDIFISTNKEIDRREDIRNSLSRIFVRLILQQHDNNDEEINQISKISSIDLTALLEMEIPDTSYLEFQLDDNEDDKEAQRIKDEIVKTKELFSKDIDLIIDTLQKLDTTLKTKPDYYKQLHLTDPDDNYINYFKNYPIEVKPNEYGFISDSDTNFGVDIRTLLTYLTFAKSQGATKTYFSFG